MSAGCAQMEAKALREQNQARASGFPLTVFHLLLHLITKCPVILVTVMFRQHPASYLLKCCPLEAQQLIHAVTCLLQNQHQTPTPPQNGEEGRSSANDEFDPNTSSFADELKFK